MNTSKALMLLQNISVTDILYTCIILEFEIFIVNWQTNKLVYQSAENFGNICIIKCIIKKN